jgi:hypothetical protein
LVLFGILAFAPWAQAGPASAKLPGKVLPASIEPAPPPLGVYHDTPYQAGEVAEYKVYYLGVFVGYGKLRVHPRVKYKDTEVQVFSGTAKTGEWYNAIYKADDVVQSYARPRDFAVEKFYLKQNESKLFSSSTQLEKWYSFDHQKSAVAEMEIKKGEAPVRETIPLTPGSIDTLTIFYKLRATEFVVGQMQTFLLYSSKKNWWLKITPLLKEEIKVPAGTFATIKLGVESYIGQQLEQKGPINVWIAYEHKSRPLVKIEGTVKIGWMELLLEHFSAGGL